MGKAEKENISDVITYITILCGIYYIAHFSFMFNTDFKSEILEGNSKDKSTKIVAAA